MNLEIYNKSAISRLWYPRDNTTKFENGQVTIVGGSMLFHGAPIFALKSASRLVDMVYFSVPEEVGNVVQTIKASLGAFIFVPWSEISEYIEKSDAVLIGPGMLRFHSEKGIDANGLCDKAGRETKELTQGLLSKFPGKKWVIDGGSLQVIHPDIIPKGSVVTPNEKEFSMLFGVDVREISAEQRYEEVLRLAQSFGVVIALKGVETVVSDGERVIVVRGGSPGLSKGGTGDLVAGLTVGLLAKNSAIDAVSAANFLVKQSGEELEKERGVMYNTDDVALKVAQVYGSLINQ